LPVPNVIRHMLVIITKHSVGVNLFGYLQFKFLIIIN
jgi:hypothetical protein